MMRAAISVDLDPLACYHAIHGLPPPAIGPELALVRWLPRFVELFAELGVRATFFVVGESMVATPEEFSSFIAAQLALWGKVIRDANIEQQ